MQQYYKIFLEAMDKQSKQSASKELSPSSPHTNQVGLQSIIDPRYSIASYELVFSKKIANESAANIYLGSWNGGEVVIKALEGSFSAQEEREFIREINIMSRLEHENITKFHGAGIEEGRAFLVME